MTPAQAASTTTHSGTTSGFGSGIGIAVETTSYFLIGISCGVPMNGSFVTRPTAIVDKFIGTFGAIC